MFVFPIGSSAGKLEPKVKLSVASAVPPILLSRIVSRLVKTVGSGLKELPLSQLFIMLISPVPFLKEARCVFEKSLLSALNAPAE